MIGQSFRSNTGLVRTVVGHAMRHDEAPALVIHEEQRGEFVMTAANFKRWLKERRCVRIDNGARQ